MFGKPFELLPHPPLAMCTAQARALFVRFDCTLRAGKPCDARKLLMSLMSAPSAPVPTTTLAVAADGAGGAGGVYAYTGAGAGVYRL
jgi:hypothetical protein